MPALSSALRARAKEDRTAQLQQHAVILAQGALQVARDEKLVARQTLSQRSLDLGLGTSVQARRGSATDLELELGRFEFGLRSLVRALRQRGARRSRARSIRWTWRSEENDESI